MLFFAIVTQPSLFEREIEAVEERAAFVIVFRRGRDGDVHPA
jgi:hypothetical protein